MFYRGAVMMDKKGRVKDFSELFELLNYYFERRDQPVREGFDFFAEVELLCNKLDLDYEEFKKEFLLFGART
jgi:hypothetical protein